MATGSRFHDWSRVFLRFQVACHWWIRKWPVKIKSKSSRFFDLQRFLLRICTNLNLGETSHKREVFGNVAWSISLLSCNAILSLSIDWKLFGPFIDIPLVESAVQTLKRGTKGNPIFRILCWNYTIVVQNTNIITHTTHNVPNENCKRMTHTHTKKNIWERQKAKPVNSEFIF